MKVEFNLLSTKKKDFRINDVKEVVKKQTYPNLFKLLQVALSIPISSATCERSFSSMRRIGYDHQWHKIDLHFYLY